jgi:integrase
MSLTSTTNTAVLDTLNLSREDQDMARRRGQRTGYLRPENGTWLLTYRIYVWDLERRKTKPERVTVSIGPAPNPPTRRRKEGELTEKQAQRFAWDHYLSKVDNATVKPFSSLTLTQFWDKRYLSHLERKKKYATQVQYKSLWKVWIKPIIGNVRLFELTPDQVEATVNAALAAKKSTGTAEHIKKVISAMVEHARTAQMFTGENPAQLVEANPHVPVRRQRAMTLEQCRQWLATVQDEPADPKDRRSDIKPLRTMSLLGLCCSMGVSEQLGLCWQHVNLTDTPQLVEGESLPASSAAIRAHSYHGRAGSLKTGNRRRNVPLPKVLVELLLEIRRASKWNGPEDTVFAGQGGEPIWADNLVKRSLKPKAVALAMPWLSPHVLRHTFATLTKDLGMAYMDREYLMGHSPASMTDRYTHEDWERMRGRVEELAAEVTKAPEKRNEGDDSDQYTASKTRQVHKSKGEAA